MNNKKKIVVLHYSLSMGGTEKVLINMLNSLDYSRVEVTLWLLESGGILENDLTKEVKIKYFDYNKCFPENSWIRLIKHNIKQFNLMAVLRILLYLLLCIFVRKPELKYYFNLKKYGLFDKKCYDLLIDYTSYRQDLLYWGLTCFKAKKHVTWLHGKDSLKPEHDMRRYAYNRYDCIFSVSKGIKEYFLALYPELKDKVEVFYNIQDIDGIISKSNEPCNIEMLHPAIVTIGRISYEKGMDRIPECMKMLLNDGYDVHWYIVGDGCERKKIESECEAKGLSKNIHFLGEKQNPYPYMKNADIYVQPSRTEGFCGTTLEAKILKKTIVVTEVPGMREQFVDGKNAIILKEQTIEGIFEAIKKLLDCPELREKFTASLSEPDNTVSNDLSKLYSLL